jgi:CheY-like chemotaxis protein
MNYRQRVCDQKEQSPMENIPLKVLCLEDSSRDIELMRELLVDAGYDLKMDFTAVEKEFASFLRSRPYDIILADFTLPGFDAFAALRWTMEICPKVPFICVSGAIGEETAVQILKQGAVDYVLKDRLVRLPSAIKRALDETIEKEARRGAEESLRSQHTLLTALINSPKDIIIFSLDKNYCYTAFNENHHEEMRRVWNADINVGMNLLDCIQIPGIRELAKQSVDRALKGESFSEIQH